MKAISQKRALEMKILFLREKKALDFLSFKEQYYITIDSLKTVNLIKSVLEKIVVPLFLELFSWSALLMSFGELVIYGGLSV